jgi:ABC-type transporter Mla subunit MlaD
MTKFLLVLFVIFILTGCFRDPATCTVLFEKIDRIQVGNDVFGDGRVIGKVIDLQEYGEQVLVKVELKDQVEIPTGSKFYINSTLLGDPYLLVKYSNSTTFLTSKDTVQGSVSQDIQWRARSTTQRKEERSKKRWERLPRDSRKWLRL